MTRTSKDSHTHQEDYDSETSDSRASTPDHQLASVTARSFQPSTNSQHSVPSRQSPDVVSSTVTRSESLMIPNSKSSSIASPLSSSPIRRSSCGDQFANRQQQQYRSHTVSYPRDTGRRYYVRERKDSEDLLANLLNLRDLLLNQNVHV